MTNEKQDNVGYCINVTPGYVTVLKFSQDDPLFNNAKSMRLFIRSLVEFHDVEKPSDFLLEGVYHQFPNSAIDIFVDSESLVKGYPLTAGTPGNTELYGNLAIFGSNDEGNSILLSEQQAKEVLCFLDFPEGTEIKEVDMFPTEPKYTEDFKPSKTLNHLLKILVNHCINHELQLVTKGTTNKDEAVMIVCVHSRQKNIDAMHSDFLKLVKSGKYKKL